ncbi:MAG: TIGR04086 family membrane protein [Bacilli bacterium]|nr:TIGR04086 family membrane protein [Bacilli bacterium]
MSYLKLKLKELLLISIIFIIFTTIYTTLIYFKVLTFDYQTIRIVSYISGLLLFFIYGVISARVEKNKGLLAGFTSALLLEIIVIIILLFCQNYFSLLLAAKLISYLFSSMIGGIIGINIKK